MNPDIENLKKEIADLKEKIGQLVFPLNVNSKQILSKTTDEFIGDKVLNANWDDYFYYMTMFDSIDGFSSSGQVTIDSGGLILSTTSTINNSANLYKLPNPTAIVSIPTNTLLSWKQPQRIRGNIAMASVSNVTAYITRGVNYGPSYPYFGFKIINNTLYGVSRDNNTDGEAAIALMTISTNTVYIVEARYLPGEKILFYVVNNATKELEQKGILTTKLPSISNSNVGGFYEYFISTQNAAVKQMTASFFEYIQKRDRY